MITNRDDEDDRARQWWRRERVVLVANEIVLGLAKHFSLGVSRLLPPCQALGLCLASWLGHFLAVGGQVNVQAIGCSQRTKRGAAALVHVHVIHLASRLPRTAALVGSTIIVASAALLSRGSRLCQGAAGW